MSSQINQAHVRQFGANVHILAQQEGSVLRNAVRAETIKGEVAFFDRIGKVSTQKKTSRHSDTPQIDTPHSRRMLALEDYEWADLIDDQDKIRMLFDPASHYTRVAMAAHGRDIDDVIIAALMGDASTGKTGSSSVALGNARKVASVSSSNLVTLNVQALRKAKFLLDSADARGKRYLALNAQQLESLLATTEITSADFNTVRALVQGEIDTFLGFKFLRTEQITTNTVAFDFNTSTGLYQSGGTNIAVGGATSCLAWAEDAAILGIGKEMKAEVGPRADKGYSTQVYTCMSLGGVRMEEELVVEILCND